MSKKKLSEEQLKEIKILQANNQMLENSIQQAKERGKEESVKRIKKAQKEVQDHIKKIDPDADVNINLNQTMKKEKTNDDLFDDYDVFSILKHEDKTTQKVDSESYREHSIKDEYMDDISDDDEEDEEYVDLTSDDESTIQTAAKVQNDKLYNNVDPEVQYDIIQLPSNGECYPDKLDRIPVGYLTAYDENFITSPNLYEDGLVIDYLLKHKIMNSGIDADSLVSGDVDAIMVWLRATSYGPEFPIVVADPETGERIETIVDLTTIKPKEFKLVSDENGHFEYTLPITKKKVKFKYLTRKEEKQLSLITKIENYGTKAELLTEMSKNLMRMASTDEFMSAQEKGEVDKTVKLIRRWIERLKKKSDKPFTRMITNILQLQVVSVDGNADRKYINKFINTMPARDSLMLRRYINDNAPGMNFNITVERPESMGGGSFDTFLNWDDSVFLNISELREKS
jgi:hypothetical protein